MAEKNGLEVLDSTDDLYGRESAEGAASCDSALTEIQTYYEQMWLERGFTIKYLCFRLPHSGSLTEPDEEIPVDGYRSYSHPVRSTRTTAK